MSLSAAAMRLLAERGLSLDDIIAVAAANEAERLLRDETPDERKKRVSRETSARHRASRNVTETSPRVTDENVTKCHQMSPVRHETSPLARVVDNLLLSEIEDKKDIVVIARESVTDDWPSGRAREWSAALVSEAASHRLDPAKQPGLTTTLGRLPAWKDAGASWEFDVLPTVTAMARQRGSPITTWKYFDTAIAQSTANNLAALTLPEARHDRPNPPTAKRLAHEENMRNALAGAEMAAARRA